MILCKNINNTKILKNSILFINNIYLKIFQLYIKVFDKTNKEYMFNT